MKADNLTAKRLGTPWRSMSWVAGEMRGRGAGSAAEECKHVTAHIAPITQYRPKNACCLARAPPRDEVSPKNIEYLFHHSGIMNFILHPSHSLLEYVLRVPQGQAKKLWGYFEATLPRNIQYLFCHSGISKFSVAPLPTHIPNPLPNPPLSEMNQHNSFH